MRGILSSLNKGIRTVVILTGFIWLTSALARAENRPITLSREDTLYVEPEQVTLLKFPVKVLRCVTDDNIEAEIQDQSVFIVAYDDGRVFVQLENGMVPSYVVITKAKSPASYYFYFSDGTSEDSTLYDEITMLIRAMYHEKPLGTYYILDGKKKTVKVAKGKDTESMKLVMKYVGRYIGYVFEADKNLEGFGENEFWVNGVVAVAVVKNRLYIVAERDIYPTKGDVLQ